MARHHSDSIAAEDHVIAHENVAVSSPSSRLGISACSISLEYLVQRGITLHRG